MREEWQDQLDEAEEAIDRAVAGVRALDGRRRALRDRFDELVTGPPLFPEGDDVATLGASLRACEQAALDQRGELEGLRQEANDLADELIALGRGLAAPDGSLAILRNTDPYEAEPDLVEHAIRLMVRYREEFERTRRAICFRSLALLDEEIRQALTESAESAAFFRSQQAELQWEAEG